MCSEAENLTKEHIQLIIADGKTPAQALAAMVGDFAKEDSLSFLAGGLSGLAMSGTYAGVNRVILEANVTQTARAVIEAGEVQDVIDYGMAQEEGTRAHELAVELQQTVDDGGERRNYNREGGNR